MVIVRTFFLQMMIICMSVSMGSTTDPFNLSFHASTEVLRNWAGKYPQGLTVHQQWHRPSEFYYSIGKKMKWKDARDDCENRGMELAMLDTNAKHNAAKSYINSRGNKDDIWIGLTLDRTVSYPPHVYRYLNGFAPTYLPWGASHEPDDQNTDFCIRMVKPNNFGFFTKHCSEKFTYLCTDLEFPTTTVSITSDISTEQAETSTVSNNVVTTIPTTFEPEYSTRITQQTDTTTITEYLTSTETDTTTVTENHATAQTSKTIEIEHSTSTQESTSAETSSTTITEHITSSQTDSSGVSEYITNTNHVYSTDSNNACTCPCPGYTNKWEYLLHGNYTVDELRNIMKEELNEIEKRLKVDITMTSSYIRSKTSAPDTRTSSYTVGTVGVAILAFVGTLCVLLDSSHLIKAIINKLEERPF